MNMNNNSNTKLNITNNINNNQNKISKSNHSTKKKLKHISNNGSQITNFNIGRDLYERGMRYKENEKEKLKVLKHNLEVDDEEDNTFIPKINKLSDVQKEKAKKNNKALLKIISELKKQKEEEKKKQEEEEEEEA